MRGRVPFKPTHQPDRAGKNLADDVRRALTRINKEIAQLRARVESATGVALDLDLEPRTDATRGAAGTAGRVIYNADDGNLNIDDGANWILPDGTTT